jgi:hypothetical protein
VQSYPHVPAEQTCPVAHVLPHVPQLVLLVPVSTQLEPQTIWPVGHVELHALITHICPVGHVVPHAPQFAGSVVVSVHVAPESPVHETCVPGHVVVGPPPVSVLPPVAQPIATTVTNSRSAEHSNPQRKRRERECIVVSSDTNERRAAPETIARHRHSG